MSIQSEIDRIITAVGNAYSKVSEKGGTLPASQTVSNLATAIDSIPAGGAPSLQSKSVTYTENGTATITPDDGYDGLSSVGVTVDVSGGGGGGIIEGLQLTREYFSFKATDVRFNNCVFENDATVAFLSNAGLYNYMGRFDNVFGASSMPIPGSDVILAVGQCALAYYKRGNSDSNSNPICDVVAIGTRIESDNPRLPTEWNDDKFKTIALSAPATGDVLAYLQSHAVKQ